MADQTATYLADGKFTGVRVLPENLLIVGIDIPEEDVPDLADPDRIELPIDDLVASIAKHGVREPVKIRKFNGWDKAVVVAGRRRVRAGTSDADICTTFGISKSALRLWWSVLEATVQVQAAVEHGKITMSTAAEIAKLKPADQGAELRRAIEAGKGAVALDNARSAAKASRRGASVADAPRRLSLSAQKKLVTALDAAAVLPGGGDAAPPLPEVQIGAAVLRAILGEGVTALSPWPALAHAYALAVAPAQEEGAAS